MLCWFRHRPGCWSGTRWRLRRRSLSRRRRSKRAQSIVRARSGIFGRGPQGQISGDRRALVGSQRGWPAAADSHSARAWHGTGREGYRGRQAVEVLAGSQGWAGRPRHDQRGSQLPALLIALPRRIRFLTRNPPRGVVQSLRVWWSPSRDPIQSNVKRGRVMLQRKISLVLALGLLALPVMAQDTKQPSAAQAAQQQKMKDCNAQAMTKNLAGDERKKFMSSCLSA